MNIITINGSPKPDGGNSNILIQYLEKNLKSKKNNLSFIDYNIRTNFLTEEDYQKFDNCDALVFSLPVYNDSIPSHLVVQLEKMEAYFLSKKGSKSPAKNKMLIYVLCNCGFYEGKQCQIALRMIRAWAIKCGFLWGQGIGIGAGEMMGLVSYIPFEKGPFFTSAKHLSTFATNIIERRTALALYGSPNIPRFLFIQLSHSLKWNKDAKKNGLTPKQLLYKIPY